MFFNCRNNKKAMQYFSVNLVALLIIPCCGGLTIVKALFVGPDVSAVRLNLLDVLFQDLPLFGVSVSYAALTRTFEPSVTGTGTLALSAFMLGKDLFELIYMLVQNVKNTRAEIMAELQQGGSGQLATTITTSREIVGAITNPVSEWPPPVPHRQKVTNDQ